MHFPPSPDSETLLRQLLQPNIPVRDLHVTAAFNLKGEQPFRLVKLRIVINQNRHHMAVNNMNECMPVSDNLELVPLPRLDKSLEIVGTPQRSKQTRLLSRLGSHHLTTPGDDPAVTILLIKLTRVSIVVIKVALIAFEVPLGMF